ncbi:MAG: redoxin domain-containing protein, partial [Bacteroidota bacterium]
LSYYPEDDTFYTDVKRKYIRLNSELQDYVKNLTRNNAGLYVSRLVQMDYVPAPPATLSEMEKIDYMREHYFDGADFSDTSLLYSQVISNKILQYLSLYQNNRFGKDQLQVEFIKAVNRIMAETNEEPQVYEYVMDYLITGFESYGFDRVITYIADNIDMDQTCVNSERKAELEKKVESLKKFAVGQKAPDFTATSLQGNEVTLSEIGSEYTLLVFWATWCPHCTQLLPKLETLYLPENTGKLEIVAVSLDDSEEELQSFLKEGNYNWINIADFKKWQGDVVQLYDIYATPTMFLLYKDRTILAKPMTSDEVKHVLFERNVLK